MEKISKFNKRGPLIRLQGLEKKSKINKRRAYVYSGLQSKHCDHFKFFKIKGLFFTKIRTIMSVHKIIKKCWKGLCIFAEKTLRICEKILCVQGLCKQWPFPQIPMSDFSFNSKPDITCMPCHIEMFKYLLEIIHESFSQQKKIMISE